MVKHSNSNQGKGIEMVSNISKFKQDLVYKKDKWADQQSQPVEQDIETLI